MTQLVLSGYNATYHHAWNAVVRESKNGNFLHLRDYINYHANRFDEQSVIVHRKGQPVAVFPCNRVGTDVISHGGLTYGGLIYSAEVKTTEVLEIFHLLRQHYGSLGCTSLIYKAIPHVFHRYPAEEDLYALFRLGAILTRRDISSVVPMHGRLRFSASRRSMISRAVRSNILIREGDFFDDYHSLLSDVLLKFSSTPVHSVEELKLLKSKFDNQIRLFGAFRQGILLAGAIIYDFGNVAHAQYLASSVEGRNHGALDSVIDYLLNEIFAAKTYFSFGISTERNGSYLNEGLIFQKEGFGARGAVHDHYMLRI